MSLEIQDNERFLDVAQIAAGVAKRTAHFEVDGVQIAGNFAGGWDVQIQGTVDGTNWAPIGGATTAADVLDSGTAALSVSWVQMRVLTNTTGTGDPPTVSLAGHKGH